MRSHLLEGKVTHLRTRPFTNRLDHAVFYFALDLAELEEVTRRIRLVRRNRPGVLTFRDGDHLDPPARDLEVAVRQHLRDQGEDPEGWRVTLVTNLRVFGYVFNPASFFLCRDAAGELRIVVVEVHNTHGERHLYTLRPERQGASHVASMDKDFYVSPFIDMVGQYTVRVRDHRTSLRIAIDESQGGEPVLHTSLVLRRVRLTNRAVARMLVRYPFVTQKTIGAIHLHAWRLWRRGAHFYRHGEAMRRHGEATRRHGEAAR
jgi:DUF1365 family protein